MHTAQTHDPSSTLTVLIAEDEPLLQMSLEDIVQDLGCAVAGAAASVKDTLGLVERLSFNVAILDVHLSDGPIDPVVAKLRELGIPFVFATGALDAGLAPDAIVVGKPYDVDEIRNALAAVMHPR